MIRPYYAKKVTLEKLRCSSVINILTAIAIETLFFLYCSSPEFETLVQSLITIGLTGTVQVSFTFVEQLFVRSSHACMGIRRILENILGSVLTIDCSKVVNNRYRISEKLNKGLFSRSPPLRSMLLRKREKTRKAW